MKKSRLITGVTALALSLSLLSGCNVGTKTSQENRKINDSATKKVVNTGRGYITMRPISATPNTNTADQDLNRYTRERYNRYPSNYYGYNPRVAQPQAPNTTTPNTTSPKTTTPAPAIPDTVTPAPTPPTPSSNIAPIDSTLMQVVDLVNAERRKAGLSDLIMDTSLSSVAGTKALDMENKGYFSHLSPTYGSPFDMLRSFGITFRSAGENIAKGQRSAQQVVTDWMNSPGHRANILNSSYTHIGVGHTTGKNCWVQMFVRK
ncbi:CAP domain-containing protein [Ectobacillus panaciterrae]|uniref:CAP domain-containing protein n=1 Tax=Ectobacillus panaciterrae TaxID=363872 RepID=UPI0003FE6B37|nr:CAP domain-containing protein [Ectobacillus panaciterrae]